MKELTKSNINKLTYEIIGVAIEVHKQIGPGLLESVYQKCFTRELYLRNINYEAQKWVPLNYKGLQFDAELKMVVLVEDVIVVELKAIDGILPVHEAQLLTYMKLLQKPKGILLNFNSANIFKYGQKTFVNEIFQLLPE